MVTICWRYPWWNIFENITAYRRNKSLKDTLESLRSPIKSSVSPKKWSNTLKQLNGCCLEIAWVCLTSLYCWHLNSWSETNLIFRNCTCPGIFQLERNIFVKVSFIWRGMFLSSIRVYVLNTTLRTLEFVLKLHVRESILVQW